MRLICTSLIVAAALATGIATSQAQKSEPGKDDYLRSCAGCHGITGKGDGPKAKDLRKQPSDLTALARANNGSFPLTHAYDVIDGKLDIVVHGPREMPSLADTFKQDVLSRMPRDNYMSAELAETFARRRMLQVIEYIMSLQNK
jgi:mono/diheme cytochrome c family protein